MISTKIEIHDAKNLLKQKLKNFFSTEISGLSQEDKEKIIRLEVSLNSLDLLNWLRQQRASVKTYWSDREQIFEMAGVGEADVIYGQQAIDYPSVFARVQNCLSPSYKNLRYYGGISFSQKLALEPSWQQFGNYRFVVPQFELYSEKDETYLACNFILNRSKNYQQQLDEILQELDNLVFSTYYEENELPLLSGRKDLPDQIGWYQNIKMALASFEQGETAKIVLARKAIFEFLEQIEPLTLLLLLKRANSQLFHFCFQPSSGNAFIGGTPERLYRRLERLIQTEAIAGTRARGKSLQEDQKLAKELLTSEKDIREHQFVVHSLRSILHQLCHSVGLRREAVLLKLNKVQHLHTPCNGILLDSVADAEILLMLHPTPAVGGYPKEQALMAIEKIEPFQRGWYAAPVGWIGHDAAEFAVAIRSGLVEHNQLSLFSGAGIVEGSKPEEEWQEIENKIGSYLQIIGCFDLQMNRLEVA